MAAVILLQAHGLGAGVMVREVEDVADFCPSPSVDALVVIAHHEKVRSLGGHGAQPTELSHIRVLEFVHQEPFPQVTIHSHGARMLLEELHRTEDQVAKVERICPFEALFVIFANLRDIYADKLGRKHGIAGAQPVVLGPGKPPQDALNLRDF